MNIKIENTNILENSNDEKDDKSKGPIDKLQRSTYKNINNTQINNKIFEKLTYFLIFKSFFLLRK